MPAFKKLISSFKLGKEQYSEDEVREAQATLKRSNAKLQKKNKSNLDLPSDSLSDQEDAVVGVSRHFKRGFSLRPQESRQNSFEPGQSVEDFDVELRAAAALRATKRPSDVPQLSAKQRSAGDGSLGSKLGLTIDTAKIKAQHRSKPARTTLDPPLSPSAETSLERSGVIGRYSLDVHPKNLQRAAVDDISFRVQPLVRTDSAETDPYEDAMLSRESWAVATFPDRISSTAGDNKADLESDHSQSSISYRKGKGQLPRICDLDWSSMSDEEVQEVAVAYSELSLAGSSDVSPTDSAIAFAIDEVALADMGKGESLQIHDEQAPLDSTRVEAEKLAQDLELAEATEHLRIEDENRMRAEELQEQLRKEQEEEERLAAEKARLRECAVCGDIMDPLGFPAKAPTAKCEHASTTCIECLQSWMASEFETKGCEGIKCPECSETLEYNDVQLAASPETFETYDKMSMRNALGAMDEFAWCLGANCGSGQLNIENKNYMDCVNCGYKQCLKHKVAWHTSETCKQYDYRVSGQRAKDEERKTEAMLNSMSKKCPGKKCGWRIQKIDGCDHMTCKRCRHEFCWQCMAAQSEIKRIGNTAHATTCKFHSHNLDVAWPFNAH